MKFFTKDIFSKCDQIRRKLWIWSYLLKQRWAEPAVEKDRNQFPNKLWK